MKQTKNYFAFGAALNRQVLFKKTTSEKYKKFFLENFQWATLETSMKWWKTEPERVIIACSVNSHKCHKWHNKHSHSNRQTLKECSLHLRRKRCFELMVLVCVCVCGGRGGGGGRGEGGGGGNKTTLTEV